MAAETQAEGYSKRERIINAIAVYPERYEFNSKVIAELTNSSPSYVYQIQSQIEAGEIENSQVEDELDDDLQQQYRDRIGDLLEAREVERMIDEEERGGVKEEATEQEAEEIEPSQEEEAAEETTEAATGGQSLVQDARSEGISVEQVRQIRDQLEIHRQDAEFGRDNFEGAAVDVAHGKYYVANQAIELLAELIDQVEPLE